MILLTRIVIWNPGRTLYCNFVSWVSVPSAVMQKIIIRMPKPKFRSNSQKMEDIIYIYIYIYIYIVVTFFFLFSIFIYIVLSQWPIKNNFFKVLWPRKGSLMKTQIRILDNRLHYTRKIELHRKGKKSRTVRITPILICSSVSEISELITVRRVHYSEMGKVPPPSFPMRLTS